MTAPGFAREPITTWEPGVRRSRSLGSSSIGVLRSASLKARTSPPAASIPARTAAPFPSFLGRLMTRSCGHELAAAWATETVASALPSSTTITSYGSPAPSRYCRTRSSVAERRCSSLKAGITRLSIGLRRALVVCGAGPRHARAPRIEAGRAGGASARAAPRAATPTPTRRCVPRPAPAGFCH